MDDELLAGLERCGIDPTTHTEQWRGAAKLLAAFDALARDGANGIVKIDGGRDGRDVYTVVVSGGRLGEKYFHRDGNDLGSLLRAALSYYLEHGGA